MSSFLTLNSPNEVSTIEQESADKVYDCIIIGGGISGLSCAKTLIKDFHIPSENVLICEAHSYVGGRIMQTSEFIKGVKVELGAEILHGSDTSLTKFAREFNEPIQEIYCWAHGDGGPGKVPIRGGYGLYWVGKDGKNQLLRYDDEENLNFVQTNDLIWNFGDIDETTIPDSLSLADYIKSQGITDPAMENMVSAGFSNTLCTNSSELSMAQCIQWTRAWDSESPDDEDYKFTNSYSCLVDHLKQDINIRTNFPISLVESSNTNASREVISSMRSEVDSVSSGSDVETTTDTETNNEPMTPINTSRSFVKLRAANGRVLTTKSVVVTATPYVLKSKLLDFKPELPQFKLEALESCDLHKAMKIFIKFKSRCWPRNLQGMIMSGDNCLVPEVWFRDVSDKVAVYNRSIIDQPDAEIEEATCYATGFATAKFADDLLKLGEERCVSQLMTQLTDIFAALEPKHMAADCSAGDTERPEDIPKPAEVFLGGRIQAWNPDTSPYVGGGYSSPRVGKSTDYPAQLAAPLGNIFFAGEATNTKVGGVVHSALDTGVRAAEEVTVYLQSINPTSFKDITIQSFDNINISS